VSHDYNFFYNGMGARLLQRKCGLPYISEIHHVPGYPRAATWRERLDRFCTRRYARWVQKHALAIRVVNSRELPELLLRWGVKPEKIRVLHSLYIDFQIFRPGSGEGKKEFDLMFCGRLVPNKGLFILLKALKILKRNRPLIRLLMVGRGPLKNKIDRFVQAEDLVENVQFVEWVADTHDLARLYRRARILVCASFNEGGPRVTVEAMACGTPSLSTPVGIMPELIREGENGMLFSWDPAVLAEKAGTLLDDTAFYTRICSRLKDTVAPFERKTVLETLANGFKELYRLQKNGI
jgi:glycosyltransferase involved in cell wall biosynthesis